jgi:hypothetical protein
MWLKIRRDGESWKFLRPKQGQSRLCARALIMAWCRTEHHRILPVSRWPVWREKVNFYQIFTYKYTNKSPILHLFVYHLNVHSFSLE